MTALSRVQRVLGPTAAAGPFELLGLPREPASEATVREAARRRFVRLASSTHDPLDVVEAQEAVAHAEALLADPAVQRAILELNPSDPGSTNGRNAPSIPSQTLDAARMALAAHGGWNTRAAALIAALAARAQISPRTLVAAARPTPRTAPAQPPSRPAHTPPNFVDTEATAPGLDPISEPPGLAPAALVTVAALAITLAGLVGAALGPGSRSAPPVGDATPSVEAIDPTVEQTLDRQLAALDAGPQTMIDSIIAAMDSALELLADDPAEAAWRFEEALLAMASRWTDAAPAELDRAITLATGFLAAAGPGGPAARRAARAVATPLGETPPSPLTPPAARSLVFSAGLAAVARSDPRVPEATRDLLLTSATTDADAFDPAARDALRRLAGALIRPNASASTGVWDAWIAMLDHLTSDRAHARLRQRITLETIEMLLLGSTPPSRDRAALHAAQRLAGRAGFDSTRAPVARARFLAWIDDPRIASIDLAILMRTLALPELASIDLSPSAAAAERELLRRRLAASWGMSDGPAPRERLAGSWRDARESLRSLSGDDPLDRLRRSVALARLLSAAESAWRGEIERAAEVLSVATTLPSLPEGDIERGAGPPGDGRWTVEYHTVRRNGELALEAVDRAASRTLGPIDARALAKVALFGSPPAVRRRAQEVAATKLDNVHLLEGVLEQLPRAPRTPRVAELIDTLATTQTGDPRANGWMLRARRALVDRLLVALGPRDALANVDELTREIRDALAPPQQRASAARESVAAAAAEIADRLLSEAASLGVAASLEAEEARRRRDGRRRVASGPIQRAVAETTALAEALAALAAAERPARAAEARRRIEDLATLQRRAASSVEQLEAALAAAVELWALRLEFSLPPATARAPALPLRAMMTALTLATAPHDLASVPLEARLAALDPAQPAQYLHLAEEVAYETPSRDGITLARRLALLAMQLGLESDSHVAASAALLLADLSPDEEQRAWLRALADTLGASAGLLRWNASPRKSFDTRLAAAEVLGLSRAEENRRAMDRFDQPAVRDALASIAAGLPGGIVGLSHRLERAPSCPECKNDRVIRSSRDPSELVLCYTCRGLPRPFISDADLVAHLRLEQYLLGGFEDWSAEIAARGIEPLRDLTLPEAAAYYNVDLNKTIYRAGAWRAPDSSP